MRGRDVLLQAKIYIQEILPTGKKGTRGMMGDEGFVPVDYILRLPEIACQKINLPSLEYMVSMTEDETNGKKLEFNRIRSKIRTEKTKPLYIQKRRS